MNRRGAFFPDRRVSAGLGAVLLVAGWACLHDAYVRRGVQPPLLLRPFLWWR